MSSDSENKCSGLFNDTLIMCPEFDDMVSIRHGDRPDWSLFPGSGWRDVINRYNPQRVIINPFWRHRIGTVFDILEAMSGDWVQLCPPGDMNLVCDDIPVRGGPFNVTVRVRSCLKSALDAESGVFHVDSNHPLRPVFEWGLFGNKELAAESLLWIIDPRLFINPENPDKGWKRRIYKGMGVGLSYRASRELFRKHVVCRFDMLHRAWASCSIADIPESVPQDVPSRWIYDFYLKTRSSMSDRSGSVSDLNRFSAIVTCRRLINFICESWMHGMYSGNYPILVSEYYVTNPEQRTRFDNLLSSYCKQLDGNRSAG